MKKNAGFTLVEIIVSFSITMIVVLVLFQLVVMIKKMYNENFIKSDLVLKQSNISQMINHDLLTSNLGAINSATLDQYVPGVACYTLNFANGTRKLCYEKNNNQNDVVSYNDYEFELVNNSKIGDVTVQYETINSQPILLIDIPITYPDMDEDFGIKISYFK